MVPFWHVVILRILRNRRGLTPADAGTPAGAPSDQEVIVQRSCLGVKLVVALPAVCRCESGPGSCQEAR
jgi:hypothetical protein